jgi:hypothetical protein
MYALPVVAPKVIAVAAPNPFTVVEVVLNTSIDALPTTDVANVGVAANTAAPVPVSSVRAVLSCAEVNEPSTAAFPVEVICPVRFAFVVTVAALPLTLPVIVALTVKPVSVPTDVIAGCAAVVTVPAVVALVAVVAVVAVAALPVVF